MENKLNILIKELTDMNKTISTMESCTGGALVNEITNIPGASEVIMFSAITYANEYKIKMGVSKEVIDKYSVYSIETAKEMSKTISNFTNSDYGIGITGKLNRVDKHNLYGKDNIVYISIYDRKKDNYYNYQTMVTSYTRKENKELVVNKVIEELLNIINN